MAANELALKAKEAFVDDDFELAVGLYTQALDLEANNADFYADRAQAYIKLNSFTEAIADASKAIELNPTLSKAYFRKGTACIKLEEYHTAKVTLEKGASLAPDEGRFTKLISECQKHVSAAEASVAEKVVSSGKSNDSAPAARNDETEPIQMKPAAPPTYRHSHYQKPDEVVVTVFAKGVPAEYVKVDFGEQILSVTINLPGEDPYQLRPRLFGKIIPEKCRYDVLATKVEIRLAKAEQINWTSLEYMTNKVVALQTLNTAGTAVAVPGKPTYPSSKPKRTDWDKLEAQVKKEEKDEKLDGDAALNKFFREIYGGADEDMRRAMNKSFVESNGTVLSTNWKEVGTKYVEGSAPDGMEMKKWEY